MLKAKVKDGWVVCGKCGHKLGRLIGEKSPKGLEIKCSSCKEINIVDKCKEWKEPKPKKVTQYKYPHCKHCTSYKEFTGTCTIKLMNWGFKYACKAGGSRTCKSFVPREEYAEHYKEMLENEM